MMQPIPWTSELLEIKRNRKVSKTVFNSVLINYYRNGNDRVAWHSDDEKELGKKPVMDPSVWVRKEILNYGTRIIKLTALGIILF